MSRPGFGRYVLPVTLGVLGLFLLIRVFVTDAAILIREDIDVIIVVSLLGLAMVMAIHTIVRLSMRYLRLLSVRAVRRQTLAEHSRFLRRLDHELKNPLTTLRAGLSALSLTEVDAQQQHLIATMETQALRLSRLVADLRKVAELEAQPLDLQPMNVEAFVDHLVQLEQDRFDESGRVLTTQVQVTRPEWVVDEDLLTLAVHNLLDNALKYTSAGGTICLEVLAQNELTIRVADTGMGIWPSDLPHVWEELYRSEHEEEGSGSGIGLALVKAIVERHDGTVEIQSQREQGTVVSLRLPAVSQS